LAGYHRYIGTYYISKYAGLFKILPLRKIAEILPRNERLKRAAFVSQISMELQRFLGVYTIFTSTQKENLLNGNTKKLIKNTDERLLERLYSQTGGLHDSLSKMLFIDTRMSLSDNLLLFNDKITMANSLEMRVPYLDIELIQFVESLPSSFKIKAFVASVLISLEKLRPEIISRLKVFKKS